MQKKKSLSLSEKRKKLAKQKKQRKAKKLNLRANNPSQEQVSALLEHYQNRRLSDAEKLAMSLISEFPQHPFGWKVLGALFGQAGRSDEALDANKKVVDLAPEDPEAHNNFGIILEEQGKIKEAEASLIKAITLKPDYA